MKKISGIIIFILIIIAILPRCLSKDGYMDCEFYLGYNQKEESYSTVLWSVDQKVHDYVSYTNISEMYHTSCFVLGSDCGEINSMSVTLDGRGEQYVIEILSIICGDTVMDYYPQEIIDNFSIQGAKDFFLDGSGKLCIQTNGQDCTIDASQSICDYINMIRAL